MVFTEFIVDWAVRIISSIGYFGVFILMTLESMIFPIPSEAVMPFAGFIASQGEMNIWLASFFATIGSIVGSVLSYYIGLHGGYPFVNRYGKYFLLEKHHLDWTVKFFDRYGEKTIFISRFIPVVRHFISIPAGVGKMKKGKFVTYTFFGAFGWNFFLAWLGFKLGENWQLIQKYSQPIDIVVIGALVIIFAWYMYHQLQRHFRTKKSQ